MRCTPGGWRVRPLLASIGLVVPAAAADFDPHPYVEGMTRARAAGATIEVTQPPRTISRALSAPSRTIVDTIHVGDLEFPADVSKGRLLYSTSPDRRPSRRRAGDRAIRFRIPDHDPATIAVRIARDGDGGFEYFASEGRRFVVGGDFIEVIDVDIDGRFELEDDGWRRAGCGMVLPFTDGMVVGRSRVTVTWLAAGGEQIDARVEPIPGRVEQLAALDAINRHRLRAGLPAADLDPDRSRGCTEHSRYLERNGWDGVRDAHSQNLGPDGATDAGARAAAASLIFALPVEECVEALWRTWYHRVAMCSPTLTHVGINDHPRGPAVIDVQLGLSGLKEVAPHWDDPVAVPGDGDDRVPRRAHGESPKEPVPDLARRGYPLMLLFLTRQPDPDSFKAILLRHGANGKRAEDVLVGDPWRFVDVRGVVPAEPLSKETAYEVRYEWTVDGEPRQKTVRFRTR